MRRTISLISVLFLVGLAQTAFAQTMEATPEELRLNEEGLELAKAGNFDEAAVKLRGAVEIQGLNVFWLNLGRIQQRAGECQAAVKAYTSALSAPTVESPSRAEVRETATRYLNELIDQCPARVTVECSPDRITAHAESRGVRREVRCGEMMDWPGGTWRFIGELDGEVDKEVVEVRAARDYTVSLTLKDPKAAEQVDESSPVAKQSSAIEPPPDAPDATVGESSTSETTSPWAWPLLISGGAMLAGALLLDGILTPNWPATARNQRLDPFDWVPFSLWVVGIPVAITGVVFVW